MLDAPLGDHIADEEIGDEDGVGKDLIRFGACPLAGVEPIFNHCPVISLQEACIEALTQLL